MSHVGHQWHHLTTMGERLQHLSTQDALLLLCNSFAIPKLLYNIRSSSSFLSPSLQRYDETLRSIVSDITNINLDETTWTQASLPVKSGRLGFRSSVQVAPSTLMTSAAANFDLTTHTLPPCFQSTYLPYVAEATTCGQWVFTYPPVWSCFPLSEGLWHPQSFCHGHHPAEASPRCCVPLPPSASLNERV